VTSGSEVTRFASTPKEDLIMFRNLACLSLGTLLIALAGCGGGQPVGPDLQGAKITGTVVEGGKPLKFLKDEKIRVSFIGLADSDGKVTGGAEVKEDGQFEITGPSGKGLPAGKYKVTLQSEIYGGGGDRFFEKLDATGSQMIVDIGSSGTDNFEIDIRTRKTVKK
jgi:hypothetical protein